MRSPTNLFLIVCTVFLWPLVAIAQKDYMITTKGDTLKGKISISLVGKVEHVSVKSAKRETFPAMSVREVFMDDIRYKPVQYSGTIQFMRIVIDGYLSLLNFKPPGVMSFDGRLLQTRDGRMMETPTLTFKKQMSNFLSDCVPLSKKIQDGELGRSDLDKIIGEYNEYVTGGVKVNQKQIQDSEKLKPTLELVSELAAEVEKSSLDSKSDILDMLHDMEDKIKSGKTVPPYLLKVIRLHIESIPDLTSRFNELAKVL